MTNKELEQALTRLAEIEPTGVVAGLIYESEAEDTYCQHCGQPTGYGRGSEPSRYDTLVCSTECAKELFPNDYNWSK